MSFSPDVDSFIVGYSAKGLSGIVWALSEDPNFIPANFTNSAPFTGVLKHLLIFGVPNYWLTGLHIPVFADKTYFVSWTSTGAVCFYLEDAAEFSKN